LDFNDTPAEAAFRAEVRTWLAENAPAHVLPSQIMLEDADEVARGKAWQHILHDAGYAGITIPKSLGGRGGSVIEAVVFAEEEAKYPLPKGAYLNIGLNMAIGAIAKHGSEAQRARFIPPTLKGQLTWCQLFSEPAAGSDLANLRTAAKRDGKAWIVNGQKLWSSWAHLADWGILVARTDPHVPKHKGLTFFVVDMRSPGIDVRPIRQISGARDFNETFLTDVRIPDENRIGSPGEGWTCCMTVLTGERLGISGEKKAVETLLDFAAATPGISGTTAMDDGAMRTALAQALAEERAGKFFAARMRTMISRGENPGALAGVAKLAYASRLQKVSGLAFEVRGLDAMGPGTDDGAMLSLQRDYIWSAALRIAGGADEVLKNQIAERVLGMPAELRVDKDVPFNEIR
jgi:alkylation response protein AidB-like acyl-CoA dehydrogenase